MHDGYAYGNWGIVVTMVLVSMFFLFRFIPMRSRLGKRSGVVLIAFLVALFTEMYGFALTIYLLGHVFGLEIPRDHVSGHLLGDLVTHLRLGDGWLIVMLLSNLLLILGIWLISAGWELVYESAGTLVSHGVYAHVRYPQYTGIFVMTLAFMIQWPTLPTLILWPFVISMSVQIARREEDAMRLQFPEGYREYMEHIPRFLPRVGNRQSPVS